MQLMKQLLAFRPSKMDLIFAAKTYIAAMLALFISFELDLLNPMWAIGTVLIVANPFSGMVSSKALYRLAGTFIGAVVAIILMPNLINTPWLFSIVVALWVGGCLYISLLDRTPRSYMLMLSGYTVAMIVFNSINNIDTHNIFDVALARFLEIGIAVICSAVVSSVIFPMHIGPVIQQRVNKNLHSIEDLLEKILQNEINTQDYTQALAGMTRDMSEIHVMAVHLSYEKSELKGMTKPLQEMLHQLSVAVANLVAMSERLKQLNLHSTLFDLHLSELKQSVLDFLKNTDAVSDEYLKDLPADFEQKFAIMFDHATPQQGIILNSLKMDIRHYIQNVRTVRFIWQLIQKGKKTIPESIEPLTTKYPSLHRDHGVAVRGGLAAVLSTFFTMAVWILTGWKAGYMMAQMGAVCACILTAIDNPVPTLKIFLWGSVAANVVVFIYAFGVFPNISQFWELAVVLAPAIIAFMMLLPTPNLMPLGLVLGINTIMGMNLQNRYSMDAVSFLEGSFAMVLGVLSALISIYFIRAMSPDETVSRLLARHYRAMRHAILLNYNTNLKIHLRSMLDRIGVLNSKLVQSDTLKKAMNDALIETSAIVDFTRLQELSQRTQTSIELRHAITDLQTILDSVFRQKEKTLQLDDNLKNNVLHQLDSVIKQALQEPDSEIKQRTLMSVNNIRHSVQGAWQ